MKIFEHIGSGISHLLIIALFINLVIATFGILRVIAIIMIGITILSAIGGFKKIQKEI